MTKRLRVTIEVDVDEEVDLSDALAAAFEAAEELGESLDGALDHGGEAVTVWEVDGPDFGGFVGELKEHAGKAGTDPAKASALRFLAEHVEGLAGALPSIRTLREPEEEAHTAEPGCPCPACVWDPPDGPEVEAEDDSCEWCDSCRGPD